MNKSSNSTKSKARSQLLNKKRKDSEVVCSYDYYYFAIIMNEFPLRLSTEIKCRIGCAGTEDGALSC